MKPPNKVTAIKRESGFKKWWSVIVFKQSIYYFFHLIWLYCILYVCCLNNLVKKQKNENLSFLRVLALSHGVLQQFNLFGKNSRFLCIINVEDSLVDSKLYPVLPLVWLFFCRHCHLDFPVSKLRHYQLEVILSHLYKLIRSQHTIINIWRKHYLCSLIICSGPNCVHLVSQRYVQ